MATNEKEKSVINTIEWLLSVAIVLCLITLVIYSWIEHPAIGAGVTIGVYFLGLLVCAAARDKRK